MQVFFSMEGKELWVRVKGEVDLESADALRRELEASLDHAHPEVLMLDLEGVTFMDSSGLGVILGRYRRLKKQGGRVVICRPQPQVRRLLEISGLSKIMTIHPHGPETAGGVD
ncbi:STAS domain-containing protein [Neomoorella mulderi]|uniref:Anti-sigma factor antagonist n=1 Tax=Moorella mulderi DSM 14980 TaxID=1122241 RepID=A0A151AVF4_9FIRM|nr:STAS domain-containing protein [Moorella mulderi]KYH31635.1 anti-sigma F factor antagonist [Moorella mulderi DSM 14980]